MVNRVNRTRNAALRRTGRRSGRGDGVRREIRQPDHLSRFVVTARPHGQRVARPADPDRDLPAVPPGTGATDQSDVPTPIRLRMSRAASISAAEIAWTVIGHH